jgi:hypothetical protein
MHVQYKYCIFGIEVDNPWIVSKLMYMELSDRVRGFSPIFIGFWCQNPLCISWGTGALCEAHPQD